MSNAYRLLLDVYPLLEAFPAHEAGNLVARIRAILTDLALGKEAADRIPELLLLLGLSKDLGYVEEDVHAFLRKKLGELDGRALRPLCHRTGRHRPGGSPAAPRPVPQ